MKKIGAVINRLFYGGEPEMLHSPAKRSLDTFAVQVIFTNICLILVGGSFICGFLLRFGAPDEVVNYVPVIPSICGVFMVFVSPLIQRIKHPKRISVVLLVLSRLCITTVVFVPLVLPDSMIIPMVLLMTVMGFSLQAFMNQIFNNWFLKSIPENIRGRYYSARQVPVMIINSTLPILAGVVVDAFADKYHAFLIVFSAAILSALLETYSILKIPDCTLETLARRPTLKEAFLVPAKDKKFMRLILYVAPFYFVLYLSASIRQIFMLKYLELSYTYINGLVVFASVLQALVIYSIWGKANDRISSRFVLTVSIWFYVLSSLLWAFVANAFWAYMLLPLVYLVTAFEGPSFNVGIFNYMYEIIPENSRAMYSSFFTTCIGLVLLVAPITGSFCMELLNRLGASDILPFGSFRLLSLFSAAAILAIQLCFTRREKKLHPDSPNLKKESYQFLLKALIKKA